MKRCRLSFLWIFMLSSYGIAQNASFSMADTICTDKPVVFINVQPPAANSYKWSFCTGNASNEPEGAHAGNPNQALNAPLYVTLIRDSLGYYTFTTSSGNSSVLRCFYGAGLAQSPTAITNLGGFGLLTFLVSGIQVKKFNGKWYGFVANGNKLARLYFGNSPANLPVAQSIDLPGVIHASGLVITSQGKEWIGFCTDIASNNLVRLDFGLDPGSTPGVTILGNTGDLNSPSGLVVEEDDNAWYAFICNTGNSTISRISFGPSLLNPAPTGAVLGNISGLDQNAGITLIRDCGVINGIVTNCIVASDHCVVHLVFEDGLGGVVKGYRIDNQGILNKPYGISEVVRQGETLHAFAANFGSSSLTRLFFTSCAGASQPFYSGPDPPPVTYQVPGKYNILLTVNDGQPDQSSFCRELVVVPKPMITLGPDRAICEGQSTILDAGAGDSIYEWSTGATTRTITVDTSGTFMVHVTDFQNCEAFDTIEVTLNLQATALIDTTICNGQSYWAQHAYQSIAGTYSDTLLLSTGCDSIVTTNLRVEDCELLIWFPNAFTPNGDGVNDEFKPTGNEINNYSLMIYDRWGGLVFESRDLQTGWDGTVKGSMAPTDVYSYLVTYESNNFPGIIHRETGTVTLMR